MFSTSLLNRHYTQPTCTLDITARRSPLSRWLKRPGLQQLQFKLQLQPDPQGYGITATLRGDRRQLAILQTTISHHVQTWLSTQVELPTTQVFSGSEEIGPETWQFPTSHKLVLGELATLATGPVLSLSALQLFDLATALTTYDLDLSMRSAAPLGQSLRSWLQTAAIVALMIGVMAEAVQWFDQFRRSVPPTQANRLPVPGPIVTDQPLPTQQPTVFSEPFLTDVDSFMADLDQPGSSDLTTPVPDGGEIHSTLPPPAETLTPPAPTFEPTPIPPEPLVLVQPQLEPILEAVPPTLPPSLGDNLPTLVPEVNTSSTTINPKMVAEVKQYFQQRWQPSDSLDQSLEYSLVLQPDGTIQQILPLDRTADIYLDRTGIPLLGNPFVSPLDRDANPRVRVVLSPNGKVAVYSE